MDKKLETLLGNLLVRDSAVIQHAKQQLMLVCRHPDILLLLYQVLTSAQNPQVRRYGAHIFLSIIKNKQWTNLSVEFKQHLRTNIIHAVIQENDESVRSALVQIVATVAKHELSGGWPELFAFVDEFTKSPDATEREIGLHVLSQVAHVANVQLKAHQLGLCQLFEQTLQDEENRMCQFYAVLIMSYLVRQIRTDEQGGFQQLIMPLLQAISGLISEDDKKVCEALQLFDELVESDVALFVPYIKGIVNFCLVIAANQNCGDDVRVKAMSFINWLTKRKKESILKHELVEPILEVMFTITCVPHSEDDEDVEIRDPYTYAYHVVYTMTFRLPPQNIVPKMMSLIEPALRSSDPDHNKAGYLALGIIVDGCSETIRNNYLYDCLQCLSPGILAPNPIIRNSALFALAQFSEHLQPDISKFAYELIPLLLNYLRESHAANDKDSSLSESYHSVKEFFKNMGKKILPYLAPLMDQLLSGLSESNTLKIRELSMSVIGSIANAIKEDLAPYFQSIMELLKPFLNVNCPDEMLPSQTVAFATLAILARVLDKKHFLPVAHECIHLGIQVMTATKAMDLKICIYDLMAALSILLKHDMSEFLQPIVDQMVESLKSNEGVTVHFNENKEDGLKPFDVENLGTCNTESDEEEGSEMQSHSADNNYLLEKTEACNSLGVIAYNCEQAFMPHIERAYEAIVKMLYHPASMVRKASAVACAQLCVCLAKSVSNGIQEATPLFLKTAFNLLPKFLTCVHKEVDRDVVAKILKAEQVVLRKVKEIVLPNTVHFPVPAEVIPPF